MTKFCRLETHVHAAEDDSKAFPVMCARVYDLMAGHAQLTAGTWPAEVKSITLAARIGKLEIAAVNQDGELDVVVCPERNWNGCTAAAGDSASTVKAPLVKC